jgi:hypothetical protein
VSESAANDIAYFAVTELPQSFLRISMAIQAVLSENAHPAGFRALVDLSEFTDPPPSVDYMTGVAAVVNPLLEAAVNGRCAVLVRTEPMIWRARLFETLSSASRVRFRAFDDRRDALLWLTG